MIPHLPELQDDHVIILARDKNTLEDYKPNVADREVWAMGHHKWAGKFATRIFEAHELGYIKRRMPEKGPQFSGWLDDLQAHAQVKPVYALHEWPMSLGPGHKHFVPRCKLSNVGTPWIESSIGYMLAVADHVHRWTKNIAKISLYGVSLNTTLQYAYQRPNALYYIGRLQEAGVEIEYPMRGCKIFASAWPSGIYGVEADLDCPNPEFNQPVI